MVNSSLKYILNLNNFLTYGQPNLFYKQPYTSIAINTSTIGRGLFH